MPNNPITPAAFTHPGAAVEIRGTAVERIAYKGARVVTFSQIDQVHKRPDGTAGRTFRENRDRFTEGADFIQLDQPDEIRRLGFSRPQGGVPASLTLVTERGYRRLCKSLNDDRAWDVFDEMLETYFGDDHAGARALAFDPGDPQHVLALVGHYSAQIAAKDVRIAELEPQAATLAQLTESGGSLSLTDAAKVLGLRRKDLLIWLGFNDWISRGQDGKLRAIADRIASGRLEQIVQKYGPDDRYATVSVRVTVSGLAELDGLIDRALFMKAKNTKAKKATGPSEGGALLTDLDGETA